VIDRITLIVSDLDRAEDDYVQTFGCRVEQRGDVDPALIGVLCVQQARGRRSLLRLGRQRIELAPDRPAPRMELLHYHVGTRRPIPRDTASNDITATHSVVRVASLSALAAALAREGRPLTGDDLMMLRGGVPAALVSGPDGHRFLVEGLITGQ
jgi:catechol 2,3-dioxygenase-like lactoylglutathione lyase family enzyme